MFAINEGGDETSQWINPNEVRANILSTPYVLVHIILALLHTHLYYLQTLFSTDENMLLLSKVVKAFKAEHNQSFSSESDLNLTTADFLQILTTPTVVDAITEILTKH